MQSEPIVAKSSVDMTLILGADSYLREKGPIGQRVGAKDPFGDDCLITLIDLVVNSLVCYLPLPADREYRESPQLVTALPALIRRPYSAAIQLKPEVEERIVSAFWANLEYLRDDGPKWFRSQMLNPIVIENRMPILNIGPGKFNTLSEDGLEVFRKYVNPKMVSPRPWLLEDRIDPPYITDDIAALGGDRKYYQYAYAFTVFRRAWQYAQATRKAGSEGVYYTHRYRERALQDASSAWHASPHTQFWSWGRCIAETIETTPQVEPQLVCDWINGLLSAETPHWIRLPQSGDKVEEDILRETVHEFAHKAGIPRVNVNAKPLAMPAKIGKEAFSRAGRMGRALLPATPAGLIFGFAMSSAVESLRAKAVWLDFEVSETGKSVANFFRRGTFSHPGLPPDE